MFKRFEKGSNFIVRNPSQSLPSLTSLVPLWFFIISSVFSYFSKVLFSGFFQFKGNFVDHQNNSKYCDIAPLNTTVHSNRQVEK